MLTPVCSRWLEVSRKVELWVEVQEVNDAGEYVPVEVKPCPDVPAAGVFQLRQVHTTSYSYKCRFNF